MQDIRVRLALLAVCLVCLAGSGWVLGRGPSPRPAPITLSPPLPDAPVRAASLTPASGRAPVPAGRAEAAKPPEPPERLYVDVAGAVRRPSLYILPAGSRVMQAVRAAGGPTGDADLDAVNLAEKVTDGEKVFVPERGHPGLASVPAGTSPTGTRAAKAAPGTASGRKIGAGSGETVALNTATLEQLERLPGVGPGMAAKILAYRQQVGPFEKPEDLRQVPGLGPKKFAKVAPFITL